MNKQIDMEAEMLKIIEDARKTYANDVTDHTENEYIREGLLNANYRKTEDVASDIFAEIEKTAKDAIRICERYAIIPMVREAKISCYKDLLGYIAKLKKKYIGEDTNVTTKESEDTE